MHNVEHIFSMMDWNQDIAIQNEGILLAESVEDIGIFIQPLTNLYNKNVWENCAKVIKKEC